MGQATYSPRQQSVWYKTLIRNTGSKLHRKHQRWNKDKPILNLPDKNGEEYQNHVASPTWNHEFERVEWQLMFEEVLTPVECCVVQGMYMSDRSQRHVAKTCFLSQAGVSRTKQKALQKLKAAIIR